MWAVCDWLKISFSYEPKPPGEGAMRGLAFLYDPDGYAVEIIQKGMAI